MKKQVVVIGLGRFGVSVATTLFNMGHDVLAVDIDEKKVQDVASQITHAIQADATSEPILKELGISNFDVAVVAMGSAIQSSVLATILSKKLGIKYVIARADNELHGSILEKIGADKVVYPEHEMGTRLASALTLIDVSDYLTVTPEYGIAKLTAPSYLQGAKLSELGFGPKGKWEAAVLLIQREKEVIITPRRSEAIKPDDVLIIAGYSNKLERLLAAAENNKSSEAST